MTNARFRDLGNGTVVELMSDQVQLFYDPTTGQARAIFNGKEYLGVNTNYIQVGTNTDMLYVDFSDKIINCYGTGLDPVTGADLSKISVAGLMTILKVAYDVFVNDRAASIAASLITPTPSPTVDVTPDLTPTPSVT